jgi:hypothetical protein
MGASMVPVHASGRWTPEQLAWTLVPRRDQLVVQLPREIAAARDLSRDQCELVVDESLDFIVTEYARPITDADALERAFWSAASFRVKRAHDGRSATIRAGWRRVELDELRTPADDQDPQAVAVANDERALALEFAAGLHHSARLVLACKYGGPRPVLGRKLISRRLGMQIGEVRKHERTITRELARFTLIVSSGTLCRHRASALAALASGTASREQELLARVHILHCARCRADLAGRLRGATASSRSA